MNILFIDECEKKRGDGPHIRLSTWNLVSFTTTFLTANIWNAGQSIKNEVAKHFWIDF